MSKSKHYLENTDLSFRAKGIFATILSLPKSYPITRESLSRLSKEGRDATGNAINELIAHGYLTRTVTIRGGRWIYVAKVKEGIYA